MQVQQFLRECIQIKQKKQLRKYFGLHSYNDLVRIKYEYGKSHSHLHTILDHDHNFHHYTSQEES